MLYVLSGADEFEKQRRRRELVGEHWLRRDGDTGLAAMVEAIGQADLFGVAPAVVLENVWSLTLEEQKRLAAQLLTALKSEQRVVVYLDGAEWPAKSELTPILKQGKVEKFEVAATGAVVRWLLTEAERLKINMDKAVAPQMVSQFGGNKFALLTELERLRWQEPDGLTVDSLAQVWPVGAETAVFGVVDVWAQRNTASALQQLRALWRQQTAPQLLISLFERQVRLLYVCLQAEAAGVPVGSWPSQLGIQPFMATKFKRWASKWQLERLQTALKELVELDYASKSGGGALDFGLERWVVQSLT